MVIDLYQILQWREFLGFQGVFFTKILSTGRVLLWIGFAYMFDFSSGSGPRSCRLLHSSVGSKIARANSE